MKWDLIRNEKAAIPQVISSGRRKGIYTFVLCNRAHHGGSNQIKKMDAPQTLPVANEQTKNIVHMHISGAHIQSAYIMQLRHNDWISFLWWKNTLKFYLSKKKMFVNSDMWVKVSLNHFNQIQQSGMIHLLWDLLDFYFLFEKKLASHLVEAKNIINMIKFFCVRNIILQISFAYFFETGH